MCLSTVLWFGKGTCKECRNLGECVCVQYCGLGRGRAKSAGTWGNVFVYSIVVWEGYLQRVQEPGGMCLCTALWEGKGTCKECRNLGECVCVQYCGKGRGRAKIAGTWGNVFEYSIVVWEGDVQRVQEPGGMCLSTVLWFGKVTCKECRNLRECI